MKNIFLIATTSAALLGFAAPAQAHITLEQHSAAVGGYYKAVFSVPHGCDGSATTQISVKIPEGAVSVKPQPKPGWALKTTRGAYAQPVQLHGATVTDGVQTVTWSGGNLPDDEFDEFTLLTYLAPTLKPGSTLYFPLVQTCEKGVSRWIQIPTAQQSEHDLQSPAPGVRLLPAKARDAKSDR